MIIIGYQGIGKSSATNLMDNTIDLESSNFFHPVTKVRPNDWYEYYCNIAEDLSMQGNVVFTSSHEVVRKRLTSSYFTIVYIYPGLGMRDVWVDRLAKRYNNINTEKNKKAYLGAKTQFHDNINDMMLERNTCPRFLDVIILTDKYKLERVVYAVQDINMKYGKIITNASKACLYVTENGLTLEFLDTSNKGEKHIHTINMEV